MAGSKDSYLIEIHYPEREEELLEMRKRMGAVYTQFVKDYILTLPISDKEKNKLFTVVMEHLYSG
jgi:hypothetical protein